MLHKSDKWVHFNYFTSKVQDDLKMQIIFNNFAAVFLNPYISTVLLDARE